MRIAIIGAGLTGLTAGFRLSKQNHEVTIFEKGKIAGGLAGGFKEKNWDWSLEKYYHHLFTSDQDIKNLISELGLKTKLFYEELKTSIYFQDQIARFDSPISLLRFPFLNPLEKMQTGIATLFLKFFPSWQILEKYTASKFLPKLYGKKAYQILWEPLLKAKFGSEIDNVSLAWFWARIHKRSARLGYFEGGFQVLIDELVKQIINNKGQILLNNEISSLTELKNQFDKIIVTAPSTSFLKMKPDLPQSYQEKLKNKKMLASLNLILVLKEKFFDDGTYWLNINDSSFPFVAVVEHTNFIDKKNYGDDRILYVGGYYPQNHPYLKMTKEQIFKEFLPYLKRINPKFDQSSIISHQSFFNLYAQPVVPINYSKMNLPHQTPDPQIILANMEQVYPWDRGTNYAVELGEKTANEIIEL
jgi:protoporphyrinogen oxidase